ncbi:hypothetical protein LPJ59_000932 [Coemansia sp. RSA 2399]|nr:hypothetical protein LPJ59_000932 [Coemansia sp. RSA 2399]
MAIISATAHQGVSWITDILTLGNYLLIKLVAATIALYAAGYIVYYLNFAPLSKIPGSKICKLTNLKYKFISLFGLFADACENDYYKYGDIYVVGPRTVVVSNPADCKSILNTHRFIKSGMFRHFALLGEIMFTTQSPELSNTRRRQVGPSFAHGHLKGMEPTIIECGIQAMRQKWNGIIAASSSGEAVVPYALHFTLTTFDIIGALGYGQRFNALKENTSKIVDWVSNFIRLGLLSIVFPNSNWFPINLLKKPLVKNKDEFVAFGNAATERRREMLRYGKMEKPKDILQAMIDAEDPESRVRMTQKQITAETIGFLIAGTDTTSLTMGWTLHYMMLYPDVYKRAVQEVRSKFPRDHTITYAEGRANLPYLDACIYESLRIRAVTGVFLARIVPEGGATFQGHFLPAGTRIGVNVAGANHHKETWDNPRQYMPERFLGEDEKKKQSVMSFSSGVRICPGKNLALYEMMTILANLLKEYDLELPSDALFRPENVDKDGYPIAMPRTQSLTVLPRYMDRDCRVVIRHAADSSFSKEYA